MGIFQRMFGESDEDNEPAAKQPQQQPTEMPGKTRELPSEEQTPLANLHITFGQATDVGQQREDNQDSVFSSFAANHSDPDLPDFGLFIVADGMGGHEHGKAASALVARTVAATVLNSIYVPMVNGEGDVPPLTEAMVNAIETANSRVYNDLPDKCGTTCTAIATVGNRAYIAHVGDSRAYFIQGEEMEQVTRDHSVVQRLIEVGQLKPEDAANHPRSSELYRVVGFNESVEVDVMSRRLPPQTTLMLCSDGLWGMVEDAAILDMLSNTPDPQIASHKLVALANVNGGADNISVIVVRVN